MFLSRGTLLVLLVGGCVAAIVPHLRRIVVKTLYSAVAFLMAYIAFKWLERCIRSTTSSRMSEKEHKHTFTVTDLPLVKSRGIQPINLQFPVHPLSKLHRLSDICLPSCPHAERALMRLVATLSNRYIKSWTPFLTIDPSFSASLDMILSSFLSVFASRIVGGGPATTDCSSGRDFVQFLTLCVFPTMTRHIKVCKAASNGILSAPKVRYPRKAGRSVKKHQSSSTTSAPNLLQFYPKELLHVSLLDGGQYWRGLASKLLPIFLPESEYSCKIFSTLMREALVCKVIQPLIDRLSDPVFWLWRFNNFVRKFTFSSSLCINMHTYLE
jgi:hypothetical protein